MDLVSHNFIYLSWNYVSFYFVTLLLLLLGRGNHFMDFLFTLQIAHSVY
jgi:hypothetical protein